MDGKLVTPTKKSSFQVLQHIDGYSYAWKDRKVNQDLKDLQSPNSSRQLNYRASLGFYRETSKVTCLMEMLAADKPEFSGLDGIGEVNEKSMLTAPDD